MDALNQPKDTFNAWRLRQMLAGRPDRVNLWPDVSEFSVNPICFQEILSYQVWWPQVCPQAIPVTVNLPPERDNTGPGSRKPCRATGYLFVREDGQLAIRPRIDSVRGGVVFRVTEIWRFETADPAQGGIIWDAGDPGGEIRLAETFNRMRSEGKKIPDF